MNAQTAPWYREPWPWLLMAGPATVVVAGIFTLILAVRSSDGVVADDYYKQGLAINRVLERGIQARVLDVRGRVTFVAGDAVAVELASRAPLPPSLRLKLVHPTRPGYDRAVLLAQSAPGRYEGRIDTTGASAWIISLEDERASWRIEGRWQAPASAIVLTPTQ